MSWKATTALAGRNSKDALSFNIKIESLKKRTKNSRSNHDRRKSALPVWFGVVILFLFGLVAYWNSFDAPLVFDDFLTIQANQAVRFGDALRPGAFGNRSLLYLTFAANFGLHGQQVWGYHLVNLILHLLNGLLILFLALHIFRRLALDEQKATMFSLLAAVFFIAHPVQTESVTYVSSRSELLSTFFYLLAFVLFVRTPERRVGFLLSLPVALLMYAGIQSKETIVSLPGTLLAYDFLILSGSKFRPVIRRWKFYLTFLVGGSAAIYYLLTGPLRATVTSASNLSPWHYLLTQSRVIVRYMQIVFIPEGLHLDYDFRPSISPIEPAVLASTAIIVATLGLAWFLRRRSPVGSFSIVWFFMTLAPTSSFIPIADVIFEHRLYLPMVGLCLSFPFVLVAVTRWIRARASLHLRPVPIGVMILLVLTIRTILRNEVWRDERRLWADVVSKSPGKARAHNALAMAHFTQGEYEETLAVSRRALDAAPEGRSMFMDTISNVYLQQGRYDEAIELFIEEIEREVAKTSPDIRFLGMEYNNLGVAHLYKWRLIQDSRERFSLESFEREKMAVLEPALEAFARSSEYEFGMQFSAFDAYINVNSWLERGPELVAEHEAILEGGENFKSRYVLGKVVFNEGAEYMDLGRTEESREMFQAATDQFKLAASLSPTEQLFWFNYAYALERLGRLEESVETYTQAIYLSPIFVEAHHNLGQLRMRNQEYRAAIDNFDEVLRLYPGHVSANLNLARSYIQIGDFEQARQHVSTVLSASPQNPDALLLLERLGSQP